MITVVDDLLAQGERTVESLARAAGLGMTTCSAHLQTLKQARLVDTRKDGVKVYYRLAGPDVAALCGHLQQVTAGTVTVLDVRPAEEFAAGHLPGAVSVPLAELPDRLADLPTGNEIVAYCRGAYCVLSYDAVRSGLTCPRREGPAGDRGFLPRGHLRSPACGSRGRMRWRTVRVRRRAGAMTAMVPGLRWWACRRTARRLQAVLDDDPAAVVPLAELDRLIAHLSSCRDCGRLAEDYRRLTASLERLGRRHAPEPAAVQRLRALVSRLSTEPPLEQIAEEYR
jgi:hypothetical protein